MRVGACQSQATAASPPPPAPAGPAAAQPLRTGTGIILTPEPGRWWPATRDGRQWPPELCSGSPIRLKPTPPLGPAAATAAATAAVGGPPLRVARSWPLGGPARPLEAHPRPIPLPLPPRALTADRGGHGGIRAGGVCGTTPHRATQKRELPWVSCGWAGVVGQRAGNRDGGCGWLLVVAPGVLRGGAVVVAGRGLVRDGLFFPPERDQRAGQDLGGEKGLLSTPGSESA